MNKMANQCTSMAVRMDTMANNLEMQKMQRDVVKDMASVSRELDRIQGVTDPVAVMGVMQKLSQQFEDGAVAGNTLASMMQMPGGEVVDDAELEAHMNMLRIAALNEQAGKAPGTGAGAIGVGGGATAANPIPAGPGGGGGGGGGGAAPSAGLSLAERMANLKK
jgi:hypothetical protein